MPHGKLTLLDLYAAALHLEQSFAEPIHTLIRYADSAPDGASLPAPVRLAIERLRTLIAEGVDFVVEAEIAE